MRTNKLDLFEDRAFSSRPVHVEARIDLFVVYRDNPDNVVWVSNDIDEADKISDEAEGHTYVVNATKSIIIKALNNIDETNYELVYQTVKTIVPELHEKEYLKPFYDKHYKAIISKGLANKSKAQLEKIVKVLDGEGIGLAITIEDINFPDEDVCEVVKEMLSNM